jgi:hypothetical protein
MKVFDANHYEVYLTKDDRIALVFGILTVIIAFIAGMIMGR